MRCPVARNLLTLTRLASAGWVGAAALFVVCAEKEATCPDLDSVAKGVLILLHFPWYYAFGFVLLTTAWLGSLGVLLAGLRTKRWLAVCVLLSVSLLVMLGDYFFIFRPMVEMLAQPAAARPSQFEQYHDWSIWVNAGGFLLWLAAAVLAAWPESTRPSGQNSASTVTTS